MAEKNVCFTVCCSDPSRISCFSQCSQPNEPRRPLEGANDVPSSSHRSGRGVPLRSFSNVHTIAIFDSPPISQVGSSPDFQPYSKPLGWGSTNLATVDALHIASRGTRARFRVLWRDVVGSLEMFKICLFGDGYHSTVVVLEGFLGVHRGTGVLTHSHMHHSPPGFEACALPDELLWQMPSGKRGASRMAISPSPPGTATVGRGRSQWFSF